MPQEQDPQFMLGVISGKIDLVLVQLASDRTSNDTRFGKVESDITTLKQHRSWLMGAIATVGGIATTAIAWLGLYHK
jgi:hypothetical protein